MKKKTKKPEPDWQFKWDVCGMCGVTLYCPACGLNMCSSSRGNWPRTKGAKDWEGPDCPVCPLMWQYADLARKTKQEPSLKKLTGKTPAQFLAAQHRKRIKAGVRFATAEELAQI